MISRCLLLWILYRLAAAASNGAKSSACENMTPMHSGGPQASISPYQIKVSNATYSCGSTIKVTLSGNDIDGYKGFLCQIRGTNLSSPVTYGRLEETVAGSTVNNCDTPASVTQADPGIKMTTDFVWTAPESDSGSVIFVCTVVKDFMTFWMNVTSQVISFNGNCEISNMTSVSPNVTSFTQTSTSVTPTMTSTKNKTSVTLSTPTTKNTTHCHNETTITSHSIGLHRLETNLTFLAVTSLFFIINYNL